MEQTLVDEHISEESLELYAMGRLAEPQVADLEEHILFCAECQEALERVDDFILAFRVAARQVRAERKPESAWRKLWNWAGWKREGSGWGVLAPAMATLAVAVAVVVTPVTPRDSGIETVRLESARGDGLANVKAGHRLHMTLDARGLPELASFQVELVDSDGRSVWSGSVKPSAQGLSITTDKAVPEGQHWLRVFGNQKELLREFGVLAAQ